LFGNVPQEKLFASHPVFRLLSTILRFLEHNFNIAEGALNFADTRATIDLTGFFNLKQVPRMFQTIPAPLDATYFISDKEPPTDPDDYWWLMSWLNCLS
jgi:hypothetical protein